MSNAVPLTGRLARELEYFEHHYTQEANQGIEPLSDLDKRRYTNPSANTIYPREFYYHLLGLLRGKDVLEIACGNGIDASICAHNGANHYAYDISQKSIEMTRRRAELNRVSDRLTVMACSDFSQAFSSKKFDRIIGYAALHHIPMEGLSEMIYDRLNPGGIAVFAEPVVNSKLLDRIRHCIPLRLTNPTIDEVPLNNHQIREFARPFDRVVRREFQLISRIWPLFPKNWPLTVTLHWLDHHLLKWSPLRPLASLVVFGLYRDHACRPC